ncbi:DNA starvation/stationary phase protection protein Dps (plasmid) [Roseobacter denitrificans]|uniref:DNA protection during starvation protein, putative n=1 Tax=Roseobacter denitrificans (strain ATCC 33942 / OCh 114) TaxID=375451 RepID=Q07GK9_ROSDO|nr:DNA starvation/stationary phase protection protein Dps [Roseobacter denitrificans]ABI93390.1 DNA protection during starvation protein, putative [Roseobacter denitrificans OCh 114]AVL51245.1 DNA starvation/stationary phase protection protein Dps [Roseobacter denitrificans]SFG47649.1 starvation-inducible DNA-binding protein [Roseobacter denitrificans OCh 114]
MRHTRLKLADNTRKTAIDLLQRTLADAIDLRLAVKQAHWTIRDPRFQQLHEFFDSLVEPLDEEIDTMAERIATLGGVPDGRAIAVGQSSRLDPYGTDVVSGDDHLEALADRFATLGNHVRESIDLADEAGDADTADIFTSASRYLDKTVWFLEAHLSNDASGLKAAS